MKRFLGTPFGLATVGCLLLAGWALWTGGILDGTIARQVRGSSVYAAPGTGLDTTAAAKVIGNRRLVVVLLEPGADLRKACRSIGRATPNTVALVLSRDDDEFDHYGCASLPGGDDENFGKSFVAETRISVGVDQYADRPLEAVKIAAVNYDQLVRAGIVPDGARAITPSLPRYLVAAAALAAVVLGSAFIYLTGRRSARLATRRRDRRDTATDERAALTAATGTLAQQLIDLDTRLGHRDSPATKRYRELTADYTHLLADLTTGDDVRALTTRVEALSRRAHSLAGADPA